MRFGEAIVYGDDVNVPYLCLLRMRLALHLFPPWIHSLELYIQHLLEKEHLNTSLFII